MNAIGKSSVVFVTLSGLFWGGWVLGSQTPEGQEAIARAYAAYTEQQAVANEDLFDSTALRAVVCGGAENGAQQPCLAVVAAGRLFVVDAGSGAAESLTQRGVPLGRLQAVLLTSSGLERMSDLSEMSRASGFDALLCFYGPADTQRMVDGFEPPPVSMARRGLQAWGPFEPGCSVIVFEGDGLSFPLSFRRGAFTVVGYRFDARLFDRRWHDGRMVARRRRPDVAAKRAEPSLARRSTVKKPPPKWLCKPARRTPAWSPPARKPDRSAGGSPKRAAGSTMWWPRRYAGRTAARHMDIASSL
jgi:hypothetical protein